MAGRKNCLRFEIAGSAGSLAWNSEHPNELWIGSRDKGNQLVIKDPSQLLPGAREYADLPGGHAEGYDDTFKQVLTRFYASVANPAAAPEYPQFVDGLRQMIIMRAELESQRKQSWVEVPGL